MSKYELVCVIDSGIGAAEIKALRSRIEKMFTIVDTDDMGLLPTVYPIGGQHQAYYVSYLVEVAASELVAIKQKLRLEQGLDRHVFYAMKQDQKLLKYADLQKKYAAIIEEQEAAREEAPTQETPEVEVA
ncbi:MAG: 30S ribosomal protein S6 [Candidatus Peribacteria bacterium]|nr:MAG: 30S ribosomal protein S6 [Candidatus Peribacteria bacterium]